MLEGSAAVSCPQSQQHPLPPAARAGLAHTWCSLSAGSLNAKSHIPEHREKGELGC